MKKSLLYLVGLIVSAGVFAASVKTDIPDYTATAYPGVSVNQTAAGAADVRVYTDKTWVMFTTMPLVPINDFVGSTDFDRIDGTWANENGVVFGYNKVSSGTAGMAVYGASANQYDNAKFNGGSKGWRNSGQWAFYTVTFPETGTYDFYVGMTTGKSFELAVYEKQATNVLSTVLAQTVVSTSDLELTLLGWGTGSDVQKYTKQSFTISDITKPYVVMLATGDALSGAATNGNIGGLAFVKQAAATTLPEVKIYQPYAGTNVAVGAPFTMSVDVVPAAGTTITSVDFVVNGVSYGGTPTQNGSLYSDSYTASYAGSYVVKAVVTNSEDEVVTTSVKVATVGSAYAYYPYGGASASGFMVNSSIGEADLVNKYNETYIRSGTHFDQVSSSVASWAEDDSTTFVNSALTGLMDPPTFPRTSIETFAQVNSCGFNGSPYAYENAQNVTFYYTVDFSSTGVYELAMRTRSANGNSYSVQLLSYEDPSVASVVKDFSFNSGGLDVNSTAGTLSTDNSASYIGIAKESNLANPQANSSWIKVLDAMTLNSTGSYVLRVQQMGGGTGCSFGGFTFLNTLKVSIDDPTSPVYVTTGGNVNLKASATTSNTSITGLVYYEGVNMLGSATYNAGNGTWDFSWSPSASGVYSVTAVATDDAGYSNASAPITVNVAATSGAYKVRSTWNEVIEIEDYDFGGAGVAFVDLSSVDVASAGYRLDATDGPSSAANVGDNVQLNAGATLSNGYALGFTGTGESLNYTVKDLAVSNSQIFINYASQSAVTELKFSINGLEIGTFTLQPTGDWATYETARATVVIPVDGNTDDDIITIEFVSGSCNLDWFNFDLSTSGKSELQNRFEVYPNPSNGSVHINLSSYEGVVAITLMDLSGRVVAQSSVLGGKVVEKNFNLNKGIYLLKISSGTQEHSKKLIIK